MIPFDYGIRALAIVAEDVARSVLCAVLVPPAAIALRVLAAFERRLPQPAGRGPRRQDEF